MRQESIRGHDHQDITAHIGKLGIRFQAQSRGRVHPLPGEDRNIPLKDMLARQIIGRAQRFEDIGQAMIREAIKQQDRNLSGRGARIFRIWHDLV